MEEEKGKSQPLTNPVTFLSFFGEEEDENMRNVNVRTTCYFNKYILVLFIISFTNIKTK